MEVKLINEIVASDFNNLICPSCKEIIPVTIGDINMPHHFRDIRVNAKKECVEVMDNLNLIISQLRSGALLRSDLPQLLEQYKM